MSPRSKHAGAVSLAGATAIVVGNMIGTGVFTSLGFQLAGIRSPFVILFLWAIGGVFALCGALSYAELAAALPRSGGEYHFLSRIFHPLVGFLAGWTSATVGFAAPIALAAMAFGEYLASAAPVSGLAWSCVIVTAATGFHLWSVRAGSRFQTLFTTLKLLLILVLMAAAFLLAEPQPVSFLPRSQDWKLIFTAPFGVSLVFVMYAYCGWNASTYIAGEIRNPRRVVPLSLVLGTTMVMLVYVGLNAAFLYSTPIAAMKGELEVGHIAARSIFGRQGGDIMALLICAGLVSSISAMTWAGPRVAQTMGEDFRILRFLARKSSRGVPSIALLSQWAIVMVLILTASFEQVLVYIQFVLLLSAALTVAGVFYLRWREPDLERPYRIPAYPWPPLLFLLLSLIMALHIAIDKPVETLCGLGTMGLGAVFYFVARKGDRIIKN